jgi:transposase
VLGRAYPEKTKQKTWDFSTDSRGRWYVNIQVEVPDGVRCPFRTAPELRVGIDLGLKSLAALSTGAKIEMPAFYRKAEAKACSR